jgi:zinc finger FYVE domain-containing protein 26
LENYDLGSGVIVNFQLPAHAIFSNTVNNLLRSNQLKKVKPLLQRGKDIIRDSNQWDKLILNCVKIFSELNHLKRAEKFIDFIQSEEGKVDAYILCGRLKSAYLLAVKLSQVFIFRNRK